MTVCVHVFISRWGPNVPTRTGISDGFVEVRIYTCRIELIIIIISVEGPYKDNMTNVCVCVCLWVFTPICYI